MNFKHSSFRLTILIILSLAFSIAIFWLIAYKSPQPLVVSIHPWIGYETLYLAREFGWLPAGVQLREHQSAGDSLVALQTGQVDAACLTLDETLRARAAGVPLTIVLVFDISAGADVVLVRPEIKHLTDLAGKRIGVERNAVGTLILSKLMEAAGLSVTAITVIDLPPDQQLDLWRRDGIDAVITYEPTATRLQHEGAQRLFDSRQMPNAIFDVLAVRSDRIESQHATITALVKTHFRGLSHLQTNHQDALYRIAAREGVSFDDMKKISAGVALPSWFANQNYLAKPHILLNHAAQTISTLMVRQGLIPREDSLDGLITSMGFPPE